MNTFDNIDKARKLADDKHDIEEIKKILNDYNQGRKIDRAKAEEIIRRLNQKDIVVASYNSPWKPGWVSFQYATDEQFVDNLNATFQYLSKKMAAEALKDLGEGDKNDADA